MAGNDLDLAHGLGCPWRRLFGHVPASCTAPPKGVTGGLRRLCGGLSQNDEPPGPEGPGGLVVERDRSAGRRRVEDPTRRSGPSHAGPASKSHPAARPPRRQRVVSGAAPTTAAEDVTRGRPTARSRMGGPCASRTAGRSCRPDLRAARRPGGAGRRRETRTGTAVASEPWADASSRRSRREGRTALRARPAPLVPGVWPAPLIPGEGSSPESPSVGRSGTQGSFTGSFGACPSDAVRSGSSSLLQAGKRTRTPPMGRGCGERGHRGRRGPPNSRVSRNPSCARPTTDPSHPAGAQGRMRPRPSERRPKRDRI
jgi:hypothetical protein